MAHLDTVYNPGIRVEPILLAVEPGINGFTFSKAGGKKKAKLEELLEQAKENAEKARPFNEKFTEHNRLFLENLSSLKDEDIIFTDPTSPVKMDPHFLHAHLSALGHHLPDHAFLNYAHGYPTRVAIDPFAHRFAQSSAVLLLAHTNPKAYEGKIFWPVAHVPMPYRIEQDVARHVFPEIPRIVDQSLEGKIGFGAIEKTFEDTLFFFKQVPEKVGNYIFPDKSFSFARIQELLQLNNQLCHRKMKKLEEAHPGKSEDELREILLDQLDYEVTIKRQLMHVFYQGIIETLGLEEVLFYGLKGSLGAGFLEGAIKRINEKRKKGKPKWMEVKEVALRFVPEQGPINAKRKSPYRELDSTALSGLNGRITIEYTTKTQQPITIVLTTKRKLPVGIQLELCPYTQVNFCERVCALDEDSSIRCSYHLLDEANKPEEEDWVEQYNKQTDKPIKNVHELMQRTCTERAVAFLTVEQVAYLLNRGPDYEVVGATDRIDDNLLEEHDKRRTKAQRNRYHHPICCRSFPC